MAACLVQALRALSGAILLLPLLACGGGGGSSATTPPTVPEPAILFIPAGIGAAGSLDLVASSTSATRLTVALEVSSVADLYGLSFDMTFPPSLLSFVSAQEENYLSADGALSTSFQAVENPTGNLVVGLSRLGDVAGAGGSGVLLLLTFEALSSGEGQLSFPSSTAFDAAGEPIPGLSWNGGTVRTTL